ncbi:MAG TPA: ABC transporter permease subunit [Firmicutes bacterium]|jgi:ABC-type transport system involved in multi-copper enzyme maturation permease subunit|nr:ABC transporter permease subunit [Bacillota bacterium]
MSVSYRMNAVKVTAKRELKSTLYGIGLYVVLTIIFLITSYASIRVSIMNVVNNGIEAIQNPISWPFLVTVFLASTYLGLCSAISISREREQGTMEVLFYGPVDSFSYVIGKYLQQILTFGVVLGFSIIYFFLISQITNFGFTAQFLGLLFLSVFLASSMVAFGIFLSTLAKKTIVGVVSFLALVLFFLIFWAAHSVIMGISGTNMSTALIYTRLVLDNINLVIQWISPIAYFVRGMVAVSVGSLGQYLLSIISSAIYSAILIALAIITFERRGAKR